MARKLRVSLALQPVATALFANSPFVEGKPSGFLSSRAHVWTDVDNARSGMPAVFFEEGFGVRALRRLAAGRADVLRGARRVGWWTWPDSRSGGSCAVTSDNLGPGHAGDGREISRTI